MPPKTKLLTFTTIVLLLLVILFGYYFLVLTRPLDTQNTLREPNGLKSVTTIYGNGKDLLKEPGFVAFDQDDNVYISDTGNHRIMVFSSSGNFINKIESLKKLQYPLGVAIGPDNNVYVASMKSSTISVFSADGKFIKQKPMDRPINLTFSKEKIYVTTPGKVLVYDMDFNSLLQWGEKGRKPGQFMYPNGVAVDSKGITYVSDTNNNRLQAFKKNGDLLWSSGEPSKALNDRNLSIGLPMGLTIGERGYLYLIDAFNFNIRVFNPKGKEVAHLGEKGQGNGYFNYASGIAFNGSDLYAVADKNNNRVQILKITAGK